MFKANILNLVLFIVVISLASVIYFSEEQSSLLNKLTDENIDDIVSITIQHNKHRTVIQKQASPAGESQWQITRPVAIAANNFRINSLLKLINAPVHNQYPLSEINAADTGLENPSTSLQLNDYLVEFGITNPATNLRYIKLNNTVYTIEDVYYPLLSSHFGTLVSLSLLPMQSNIESNMENHIEKLILANQTITKNENGLWQSNSNLSADNINKTIDHWKSSQAFGVREYMPREENYGEVFIYFSGDQQPLRYRITDTDPWLIMARPEIGLEYHLDIEAYDRLIAPQ